MATLFERFSSRENLKRAYRYVQDELAHATLSVNPINHPALTSINALGDQFFIALERYLRDEKYVPERGFFVYIPKDNLGLRPVCMLSMIDRIVYQALFNPSILGHKIDGQLSEKVCFANRVSDDDSADSFISPYFNGWEAFCKAQERAFERDFIWKLEVDVQQYYEHIPIGKLITTLRDIFGVRDEKILNLLKLQLCTWAEYPELPKGIPQGPSPSAVLGNVYLAILDSYAEHDLANKNLRYLRYADDIVLMGKSKEDVLRATEKIVRFLRGLNLNLNEKTHLAEIPNAEVIAAMRVTSDYEDNTPEIPPDELTLIQERVPFTVLSISGGGRVEKSELRELKYYLKVGKNYSLDFILSLIEIIPLRPSLTIPIIQYVSEGREFLRLFGDSMDTPLIDFALWETYSSSDISEWSKFWILKLLASSKGLLVGGIEEEIQRILTSEGAPIFKVVGFYFEIQRNKILDMELVKNAIRGSETEVEKSLYSFFLLHAFNSTRAPVVRDCIERAVNSTSQEMNLIGCYLYQSNPKVVIDDISGPFASYVLKKRGTVKKTRTTQASPTPEYYIVRSDTLTPLTAPLPDILGINRKRRTRRTKELHFSEPIRWEKVKLKLKEGEQDVEIFYDDKYNDSASYVELGFFSGKKQQKPSRQWGFLCALASLCATDVKQATPDKMRTMVAVRSRVTLNTANVHQIKKNLANQLREVFKTGENPFHDTQGYYHPKFSLLPEPVLRQPDTWKRGGSLSENALYGEAEE